MENKVLLKPITENNDSIQFSEPPAPPAGEKKRKIMHKWTDEEDQALCMLVSKKGSTQWSAIAKSIPGRSGKQCRERWYNHLNPAISHLPWTDEEDELLREYQRKMGNQWTKIAEKLTGRSENEVKNRANSLIRKAKTMNKRFQKSMSKLIPPSTTSNVSNNVMEGPFVQPSYYPTLMSSSGYVYKPIVYSYDPSKPLSPVPTVSVQASPLSTQSMSVKRTEEIPSVYYPYGYSVPVEKTQPYEVVPNYGYSVPSKTPYECQVLPTPGYVSYPSQTTPQAQMGIPCTLAPYPAYPQVYTVNNTGNTLPNQYLPKRYTSDPLHHYDQNPSYVFLHPDTNKLVSHGEEAPKPGFTSNSTSENIKLEKSTSTSLEVSQGVRSSQNMNGSSNHSNYDSSSDLSDGKEICNQNKMDILQQVCHQIMENH